MEFEYEQASKPSSSSAMIYLVAQNEINSPVVGVHYRSSSSSSPLESNHLDLADSSCSSYGIHEKGSMFGQQENFPNSNVVGNWFVSATTKQVNPNQRQQEFRKSFDFPSDISISRNSESFDTPMSKITGSSSQSINKRRKSAKSSYKHIPHSEKPVHLVARRNARERKRVQAVNLAFVKLRKCVPVENRGKRLSKVKTLHRAIEYIAALERLLDTSRDSDAESSEASSKQMTIDPSDDVFLRNGKPNLVVHSSSPYSVKQDGFSFGYSNQDRTTMILQNNNNHRTMATTFYSKLEPNAFENNAFEADASFSSMLFSAPSSSNY